MTNVYKCAPSTTSSTPGSLTGWIEGDLDCTIHMHTIESSCDPDVPQSLEIEPNGPILQGTTSLIVVFDGMDTEWFPTHDPCGLNAPPIGTVDPNARGTIYVR